MSVKARGNGFQAYVALEGQRHRHQFDTADAAHAWEAAARAAILAGKPVPPPKTGRVGKASLSTLGSLFDHVKRTRWEGLSAERDLVRNGRYIVDYFGRERDVNDISSADISEMAAYFAHELNNSGATVNRKLSALKTMLRTAHDEGALVSVPKFAMRRQGEPRPHYLDDAKEALVLHYWQRVSDEFNEDLTVFLIDTGARCFIDAGKLQWEHIMKDRVSFWKSKGDKWRVVPLTKRAFAALERRRSNLPPEAPGPFYFPPAQTDDGRRGPWRQLQPSFLRSAWDTMQTVTNLPWLTPHVLRHTCATRLVTRGVDLRRVKDWLGHESIQTTMKYAKLQPNALFDVVHVLEEEPQRPALVAPSPLVPKKRSLVA